MPRSAFNAQLTGFLARAIPVPGTPAAERPADLNDALGALLSIGTPAPVPRVLAARAAAAHLIMMECLRLAMRDGSEIACVTLRRTAARMTRVTDTLLAALIQADRLPADMLRSLIEENSRRDPMSGEDRGRFAPWRSERDIFPRHDPMSGEKPAATPTGTPTTGTLRNGNPRRDLRSLPCCGAATRAGTACRQPAMRNGRCRLHGGKSTGPGPTREGASWRRKPPATACTPATARGCCAWPASCWPRSAC